MNKNTEVHSLLLYWEKWNGNNYKYRKVIFLKYKVLLLKQGINRHFFTHWVWFCPPIQGVGFYVPSFWTMHSVPENSAYISEVPLIFFSSLKRSYFIDCNCINVGFISWFEIYSCSHSTTIRKTHCPVTKGATTDKVSHKHLRATIHFDWKSQRCKTLNHDTIYLLYK